MPVSYKIFKNFIENRPKIAEYKQFFKQLAELVSLDRITIMIKSSILFWGSWDGAPRLATFYDFSITYHLATLIFPPTAGTGPTFPCTTP